MLGAIFSKAHIIIILYGLWNAWEIWEDHSLKVGDISAQIPIVKGRINKLKRDRKRVKGYLEDIEKAKEKIKLVEEEVRVIQKKLPEKIQDSTNISIIKDIGSKLNIQNIFLAPGTEDDRGFYFAKKYDLTGTGTYLQFLLLFEKLSSAEQLFNVSSIEFKKSDVKRRGRYQLVNAKVSIESYRYNPNNSPAKEIEEDKDEK